MGILLKLFSIFKTKKSIAINDTPLQFTEEAILQIKSHLEKRPANVKSAFKVSIAYQKESFLCQVGYDDFKIIQKTIFEYPVPIVISEQDELFLKGSYVDYHKEEAAFFYYPNVNLEVSDRSNGSIFIFYVDRFVIDHDSPIKTYAIDREDYNKTLPYMIRQIFETNLVESLYLEKNILSIEKINSIGKDIFEKQMADTILSYFEKCGYPLYITDSKIEVKQFV